MSKEYFDKNDKGQTGYAVSIRRQISGSDSETVWSSGGAKFRIGGIWAGPRKLTQHNAEAVVRQQLRDPRAQLKRHQSQPSGVPRLEVVIFSWKKMSQGGLYENA